MPRHALLGLYALAACGAWAAEIGGVVRDPSGALIAGAELTLSRTRTDPSRALKSGPSGEFRFTPVPAGEYRLTVASAGFDTLIRTVTARDRRATSLVITLRLQDLRQQLTITDRPEGLSTDAGGNQDSPRASGADLLGLPSLDGDYLAALSQFLDPAAIGSGGVSVVIDGHEGPSSHVPLSQVKEIRINNNPYSAQFSAPGRGRVEVITKDPDPGLHGDGTFLFRTHQLNAREAFALSKPAEQWRTYQGTLTGPIRSGKHDSFMLSADRKEQDTVGVVYAATPAGLVRANVPTPRRQNWYTARWNHRYGKSRSFWLGYEHDAGANHNQTVGGTRLPETGVESGHFWNEILFSDQGLITDKLSHSLRGWIGHVSNWTGSLSNRPSISVSGAFTSGGAQQDQFTARTYFVIYDMFTYARGRHTYMFGAEVNELTRFGASMRNNYGGSLVYASLGDYRDNRPALYTQNFGTGHGVYGIAVAGSFVQDDIQLRPGLSLQIGLRYFFQNHLNRDLDNFAPRFGYAWSPHRSRKVVLRGGTGVFYDRQQPGTVVDTVLYDGRRGGAYVVNLTGGPAAAPAPGITRMDQGLRIPASIHFSSSAEFLLAKNASLSAAFVGARGKGLYRSNDLNAPLPPFTAGRPDSAYGQIRNIESHGSMTRNALELTTRGSFSKRLTGTAQYTYGSAHSDTEGLGSFPATPGDWAPEWGRTSTDVRHRLAAMFNADGGPWLKFGATLTASTGMPVNVTTGGDENRDGIANDRPAGLRRNSLQGPGLLQCDLRWSRRFASRDRKHVAAIISLDAFNVLNHVNYSGYVGVLRSPLFGQPVATLNARRIQAQLRFEF